MKRIGSPLKSTKREKRYGNSSPKICRRSIGLSIHSLVLGWPTGTQSSVPAAKTGKVHNSLKSLQTKRLPGFYGTGQTSAPQRPCRFWTTPASPKTQVNPNTESLSEWKTKGTHPIPFGTIFAPGGGRRPTKATPGRRRGIPHASCSQRNKGGIKLAVVRTPLHNGVVEGRGRIESP